MSARTPHRAAGALGTTVAAALAVATVALCAGLASAQRPPSGRRASDTADATISDAALPPSATVSPVDGGGATSDAGAPDAAAEDAVAPPGDAETLEARRLRAGTEFAQGLDEYRRGNFAAAARHFGEAYDALPDPAPLFNMARSWEGANEVDDAILAYERYLAEAPQARDRAEVSERLSVLRSRPVPVFVSSDPPGAFVFVDEDPNPRPTTTPLVFDLRPGVHVVVLDREGYRRTVRRFSVNPGQTETLAISLPPDTGYLAPNGARSRMEPRVSNRRADNLLSLRLSFLFGAARPWNGAPLWATIGADASLFIGRSLTAKIHFERVEPDGVWTLMTADFGYMFLFEDLDIGAYLTAGVGYGALDRLRPDERRVVPALGFEARAEWQFHPRLSAGLFFRATWRNFFIAPIEPLNSFGLSVSLTL